MSSGDHNTRPNVRTAAAALHIAQSMRTQNNFHFQYSSVQVQGKIYSLLEHYLHLLCRRKEGGSNDLKFSVVHSTHYISYQSCRY